MRNALRLSVGKEKFVRGSMTENRIVYIRNCHDHHDNPIFDTRINTELNFYTRVLQCYQWTDNP